MSQCQIVSCDILLEFLEVAFNEILYSRNLYPKEIFVRKKIYGIAVNITRHPEINEYIKNILQTIKQLIIYDDNSVKSIHFVFCNGEKLPIERYIFHLIQFQFNSNENDPYFLKTEEALRALCLKLSMTNVYLNPLPDNSIFSIEINTYEAAHMAINENPKCENFPWIIKETVTDDKKIINNNLLPISTIKTEYLHLQMYVIATNDNNKL